MAFFDRFFPVLGSEFGLGALGVFQTLYVSYCYSFAHAYHGLNAHLSIGATILSHHVDGFTLVSAFFLFSVGCLNIMLGLIFREQAKSKRSIRAWKANDAGALPMHTGNLSSPTFHSSIFGGKSAGASKPNGFGFGVQGEKQAGLKGACYRSLNTRAVSNCLAWCRVHDFQANRIRLALLVSACQC
jgi:hypothetical protein